MMYLEGWVIYNADLEKYCRLFPYKSVVEKYTREMVRSNVYEKQNVLEMLIAECIIYKTLRNCEEDDEAFDRKTPQTHDWWIQHAARYYTNHWIIPIRGKFPGGEFSVVSGKNFYLEAKNSENVSHMAQDWFSDREWLLNIFAFKPHMGLTLA